MRIEKRLRVEFNDSANKAAGSVVRRRLNGRENAAEEFGERVRAQGHAGDDAEPAAAPLERPEEVRIRACVGDPDLAVGGHDLSLDEARPRNAVSLLKASEASALNETCDPNRHAAAALYIASALGCHRIISLSPI